MQGQEAREGIRHAWEGGGVQPRQSASEAKSICGGFAPAVRVGRSRVKNALNKRRWGWTSPPWGTPGSPGRGRLHPGCGPILSSALFRTLFFCGKQIAEEGSSRPAGKMILQRFQNRGQGEAEREDRT